MHSVRYSKLLIQRMKTKHLIIATLLLVSLTISAQTPRPLVIEGEITNSLTPWLLLGIQLESGLMDFDTIRLDQNGHFYYETDKVLFPQKISLQNSDIQLNDFFVAPGYHLTITGNGADFLTLFKTAKIKGATSNRYKELLDSIMVARMDMTIWHELKGDSLLQYIREEKHLTDSVEKVVFKKNDITDPFLSHFGRMTYLNNQFLRFYYLLAGINMKLLEEGEAWAYALELIDKEIFENPSNDEFMISDNYKDWFLQQYLKYSINKDLQEDSSESGRQFYRLEKVDELFIGKVREYMMYRQLASLLASRENVLELNECKPVFEQYVSELTNNDYKQSLIKSFQKKENLLIINQKGNPAPVFTLKDDKGETYSLADFHGKVVYLDLWASWCAPCRNEIPALKEIYEKYRHDDRIAIIGIAVHDGYNKWKMALDEVRPGWLQLHDSDGIVGQLYEANAIPKYILIDKKGNIVEMDAPRPSNRRILEEMLNELMCQ